MDTIQINTLIKSDPVMEECFGGVFARDNLPVRVNKECFICNTDDSKGPGKHWVAIFIENGHGEYFDSYGLPPLYNEFLNFLSKNTSRWVFNSKQLQSLDSSVCGHYCVLYLAYRCRGMSLSDFVELFTNNKIKNDHAVERFVTSFDICNSVRLTREECCYVQSCKAYHTY